MVCVLGQKSSFYKSICLQKIIKLYLLDFLADSHPLLMADFFSLEAWRLLCGVCGGGTGGSFSFVSSIFLSSRLVNSMTQHEIHDCNSKVRNVPVAARYLHFCFENVGS